MGTPAVRKISLVAPSDCALLPEDRRLGELVYSGSRNQFSGIHRFDDLIMRRELSGILDRANLEAMFGE